MATKAAWTMMSLITVKKTVRKNMNMLVMVRTVTKVIPTAIMTTRTIHNWMATKVAWTMMSLITIVDTITIMFLMIMTTRRMIPGPIATKIRTMINLIAMVRAGMMVSFMERTK